MAYTKHSIVNRLIGNIMVYDGGRTKALREAKRQYSKYAVSKVVPYMGSVHKYEVYGHPRRK